MSDAWSGEIGSLLTRVGELIARADLGDDAHEIASEALGELTVIIEELHNQNTELLSSRDELRRERERYRDLFEHLPDGYVITDGLGMIRDLNATALDLLGQTRSDLAGRPLANCVVDADRSAFHASLHRMRDDQSGGHLTVNLSVRDHPSLPVNLRATVDESKGDRTIKWLIHDRSDELATEAFRASEEQLRALFQTAAVGIVLSDRDGVVLFANAYAHDVLGWSDEISDPGLFSSAHPADLGELESTLRTARNQRYGSFRHRVLRPDGTERWVDHSVIPFPPDPEAADGYVSTISDVTAEHEAVVAFRQERDFNRAILDSIATLVVVGDDQGRIEQFNRACQTATGFSAEEVVGRSFLDALIPAGDRALVEQSFARLIRTGAGELETDWLTADGGRIRVAWVGSTLRRADGSFRAFIGAGNDVTERRLLEARLAQADRFEAMGRVASGLAHDLNNALTLVRLRIDRIADRHLDDEVTGRDLESLVHTVERTKNLISDMLSFSRRQDLKPRPIDLAAEAGRIRDLLEDLVGATIQVNVDVSPDRPVAFVDPDRFDQVLTNLALNASDAMPDGGMLSVAFDAQVVEEATVVRTEVGEGRRADQPPPGTYVRTTVTDSGTGIAPGDLAHVFDPYFTTKPAQRGTGLGLATTHGIVNQSKGTITVKSRLREGTTFTIWLPHATPGMPTAEEVVRSTPSRDATVLIVEDDVHLGATLSEALREAGYRAIAAQNAQQALEQADHPVDLLVADLNLPDIDGAELATRFTRQRPDVPVLYITGASPAARRAILDPDASVLIKPFSTDELINAVESRLAAGPDGP